MKRIVGIYPGLHGAVAVLDENAHLTAILDLPHVGREIDGGWLAKLIAEIPHLECAWVELRSARPGQAAQAAFDTGWGSGVIEGVLATLERCHRYVTPARWQRDLKLGADKTEHRVRCKQLWPDCSDMWDGVKDDGRANAALIAWWGLFYGVDM